MQQPKEQRLRLSKPFKLGKYTIGILLFAIVILLSTTTSTFLRYDNLYSVFYGLSIQFFAVIGFTFLIIMGEIDLSIGSMYGLSGTLVGYCTTVWKWPVSASILAVLLVCTVFGYCIGYLITRFRLNSMMVTLGSMAMVAGINAVVFNSFRAVTYSREYRDIAKYKIINVHWTILAMLVIVIIFEMLLRYAPPFRKMYYIGNSELTARLYGINTGLTKNLAFAASSLTAAIGGIVATSRISHSDILTGNGLEFTIITAMVVGGASLAGGRGSMLRSFLGMLFIAVLFNCMTIFRIEPFAQQVMLGVVLVAAVFMDSMMSTRTN